MSHNTYTINNDGADVTSYHGASLGYIYIGHGEDALYQGAQTTGSKVEFYDSNPINTIEGASFTKRAGTNWIQDITLPAGKYIIHAYTLQPLVFTGQGADTNVFWEYDGATEVFNRRGVFFTCNSEHVNDSTSEVRETAFGYLDLAATRVIYWKLGNLSGGTRSSAGNRQSKSNFLFVRKIG